MKSKASLWWFLVLAVCLGGAGFFFLSPRGTNHPAAALPNPVKSSSSLPPTASPAPAPASANPADAQPAAVLAQNLPPAPVLERAVIASGWRTPAAPTFAAFTAWTDRYTAAAPADRPALVAEGVALAKDRRAQMLDLIQNNPREALVSAVPLVVRGQLPTAVLDQLEQRVSGEGDLYRVAGMPGPAMDTVVPTVETATINGDVYATHRYGERQGAAYLRDASLHGVAIGQQMAVSASPVREVEPGENTPGSPTSYCMVAAQNATVSTAATGATPAGPTTFQVGNQFNTTCCSYCTTNLKALENRLLNAEKAGVPLATAENDAIMGLGDGGVAGSDGNTNKPPTSWTNGAKKLVFMRVDFTDKAWPSNEIDPNTGYDLSVNGLTNQVTKSDGMMARISRISYGQSTIASGDVTPVLHLNKPTTNYWVSSDPGNCNNYWGPIQTDARAAATAAGYNMNNYVCYVVVHPQFINNGAAAWGGGGQIWCNGYTDAKVLTHEYGHVFWLPHANSYTTTDGNILSANRVHVEYGDAADTMGNAWESDLYNDYNAYFKSFCNWLPDTAVQTITHAGTYRLYQNDGNSAPPGPRVLKVNRNGSYDWWLAYRGTAIPSSQADFTQGVSILEVTPNTMSDTHLLDMNDPTQDTHNAPLLQGQVFNDTADGITLTNAGRGGYGDTQYIYVKVAFTPNHVTAPRPIVNGGIYHLRNKYYNTYLEVPNGTATAGTLLRLWPGNTSTAQQWVAHRNADGTYSFNHIGTDQWIDTTGNAGGDYTTIGQWYSNGVDGQCWAAMPTSDGYVEFRHRTTNEVLSADTANNGNIIQYGEFGGDEQKWTPELVGITEGTYKLAPRNAPALVLDLSNRGTASGGQLQTAVPNGGKSQLWTVKYNGGTTGQFRLINAAAPTKSLGLAGGPNSVNGAAAVLADNNGTADQLWTFVASGSSWVNFKPVSSPGSTLDVLNQNATPGTTLQIWSATGNTNQQFQFLDPDL